MTIRQAARTAVNSLNRSAQSARPAIRTVTEAMTGWFTLTLLIGACPGIFLWPAFHTSQASYLFDNKLPPRQRLQILIWLAVSAGVLLAVYLGCWLWQRRNEPVSAPAVFRRLNRYTFALTALPVFNLLRIKDLETQQPFLVLLTCVIVSAIAATFAYFAYETAPAQLLFGNWLSTKAGLVIVAVLGGIYAFSLSRFSITNHHNLGTSTYDLGIYTNIFWQTIHGNLLGCSFLRGATHIGAHFDPLLIMLSPLFLIYPQAETLLVLQSVWLATGVIPLYLIAVRRTASRWFGVVMAIVYLSYPALHGPNMYDFHSLTLSVTLIFWCVYLLEIRRFGCYWPLLVFLLFTREDMAFLGCALGVYAISARRAPLVGVATVVISLGYFAVTKLAVMTNAYGYVYYFRDLTPEGKKGVLGLAWTAVTNPGFVLVRALTEKKLLFALKLLLPVLCIPLFSGKMWILFAYGFAFTLLASRAAVYHTGYQYACLLFPFLLAATPRGLVTLTRERVAAAIGLDRRRLRAALVCAVCISSVLVSRSYGVFWQNSAFRGGQVRFERTPTDEQRARYQTLVAFRDLIGPAASVATSGRIGAHFAARKAFYRDPTKFNTDYLVVWDKDVKANKEEDKKWREVQKSRKYRLVRKLQGIALYKRRDLK